MNTRWGNRKKMEHQYYNSIWHNTQNSASLFDFCIITRLDKPGYWVSPIQTRTDCDDIGPFDSFDAAAAAYETLQGQF